LLYIFTWILATDSPWLAYGLSLSDKEERGDIMLMHCATCRREVPSVQQREEFCPAFLCDDCYEYEKTHRVFMLTTNLGESQQLYDKLWELRKRIDELRREDERLTSQKKASPLFNKDS